MIVTKLVYSKKDPNRANLFIDGKFEASVLVDSVISMSLKSGDEITEIDLRALKSDAGWQKWIDKIYNFISVRPRSSKEVADYIAKKLFKYKTLELETGLELSQLEKDDNNEETNLLGVLNNKDLIESLTAYVTERGYVNDLDFAIWFIKQRLTGGNPKGLNYIKSELYSKGVSKSEIELAFEKIQTEPVKYETMALDKAFAKQVKKYSTTINDKSVTSKIFKYLISKGFKYSDIKLKVDEYKHQI